MRLNTLTDLYTEKQFPADGNENRKKEDASVSTGL